jgi:hypothetical protein
MRLKDTQTDHIPVEFAAIVLGVSTATVWRLAKKGLLHRRRLLGRTVFRLQEVEALARTLNGANHVGD